MCVCVYVCVYVFVLCCVCVCVCVCWGVCACAHTGIPPPPPPAPAESVWHWSLLPGQVLQSGVISEFLPQTCAAVAFLSLCFLEPQLSCCPGGLQGRSLTQGRPSHN